MAINDIRRRALSRSAWGVSGGSGENDWQRINNERLRWEVNQAMAHGLLPQDSGDRIDDRSNLVQRVLQLDGPEANNNGGVLETIGDVLSVPNYLMASTAEAEIQRKLGRTEGLGAWANTWSQAWQNKTDFYKLSKKHSVFPDAWGLATTGRLGESADVGDGTHLVAGIGMDIALDPLTYLTLGVKPGLQVIAKAGRHAGKTLTLNRFGTDIWRAAAQEIAPRFAKDLGGRHLLDGPMAPKYMDAVTNHMMSNFDRLKTSMIRRQRQGMWRRATQLFPASQANRSLLRSLADRSGLEFAKRMAGTTLDDAFQETAGLLGKDRGIYDTRKLQSKLTGADKFGVPFTDYAFRLPAIVGKPFKAMFDTFDRGWQAPADVVEAARLMTYTVGAKLDDSVRKYQQVFKGLSEDELEVVTEAIEARSFRSQGYHHPAGAWNKYKPQMEYAIRFVQREMDDILGEERALGYATERVDGYINHVYTFNPTARQMALNVIRKNMEENPGAANRFTQQRMVASIAEGEEIFGDGTMIKNVAQLLAMRKKASLQMVHGDNLMKYIVEKHGVPAAILHSSKNGLGNGLVQALASRIAVGSHEVLPYTQVYRSANGELTRLGFRNGDISYNQRLLKWLSRPNDSEVGDATRLAGRNSDEGLQEAQDLAVNEHASMFYVHSPSSTKVSGVAGVDSVAGLRTSPMPSKVKFKSKVRVRGRGADQTKKVESIEQELDIETFMKMMQDPKHPAWGSIFKPTGRGSGDISAATPLLKAMDDFSRKNLDSQLPGFISDVEERVMKAWKAHQQASGKKITASGVEKAQKSLAKLVAGMTDPLEIRKLEPQLPVYFVQLAEHTREAIGSVAHKTPPSRRELADIRTLAAELGFNSRMFKSFIKLSTGDETIKTAEAAAYIYDALRLHTTNPSLVKDGRTAFREFDLFDVAGQSVVRVSVTTSRKLEGNVAFPEILDAPRGIETAPGKLGGESPAGAVVKASTVDDPAMLIADRAIQRQGKGFVTQSEDTLSTRRVRKDEEILSVEEAVELEKLEAARLTDEAAALQTQIDEALDTLPTKMVKNPTTGEMDRVVDMSIIDSARKLDRGLKAARKMFNDAKKRRKEIQAKNPGNSKTERAARSAALTAVRVARAEKERLFKEWSKPIARTTQPVAPGQALPKTRAERKKIEFPTAGELLTGHKRISTKVSGLRTKMNAVRNKAAQHEEKAFALRRGSDETLTDIKDPGGVRAPDGEMVFTPSSRMQATRKLVNEYRDALKKETDPRRRLELEEKLARASKEAVEARRNVDTGQGKGLTDNIVGEGVPQPVKAGPEIDVYLPEGLARFMRDLDAPSIDPAWSDTFKKMVLAYDRMTQVFKANLMLPHGGYWMRNVYSNTGITFLAQGAQFMSPEGGFKNMRDFFSTWFYLLGRHTSAPSAFGAVDGGKLSKMVDGLGKKVIQTDNGRRITVAELAEEMRMWGVYHGLVSGELLNRFGRGTKLGQMFGEHSSRLGPAADIVPSRVGAGAVAGAGAGATAGAAAGGIAGAVGDDSDIGDFVSMGSALGLAAGLMLGTGSLAHLSKRTGIPVPGVNGITGMMQSNWSPVMRAGEAVTEMPFRSLMFLQEFKRTGSMYEAANKMYTHLNDWNNLTAFEKRVMRRIFPFYNWTKLAFRQTFTTMMEEPGRLANIHKTFRDWNNSHDYDPEDIPDFYHEKLAMLRDVPVGDQTEREVLTGFGLPIEDVADITKALASDSPGAEFGRTLLGRGPFIGVSMLEVAFDRDSFTGREIVGRGDTTYFQRGERWDTAPSWLKSLVGYREASENNIATVDPRMSWMLGETPVSRFVLIARQIYELDDQQRQQLNYRALSRSLIGVNAVRLDPETQQYFADKAKIDMMSKMLQSIGAIRTFTGYSDVNKEDQDWTQSGSPVRGGRNLRRSSLSDRAKRR